MNFSKKLNLKKVKVLLVAFSCLIAGTLFSGKDLMAQNNSPQMQQKQQVKTDFSKQQLKNFVSADKKMAPIQQQSQQKMMGYIKDAGLTVAKFQEIAQQKQQGKDPKISKKETLSFNKAAQQVMKEKKQTQDKMTAVIKNAGLDIQTFQQITMAYQQDPQMKKKINSMIQQQK